VVVLIPQLHLSEIFQRSRRYLLKYIVNATIVNVVGQ